MAELHLPRAATYTSLHLALVAPSPWVPNRSQCGGRGCHGLLRGKRKLSLVQDYCAFRHRIILLTVRMSPVNRTSASLSYIPIHIYI